MISIDFIEKLLFSSDYNIILVIIDQLSKQAIFMLIVNTITLHDLAKLFMIHIFSKYGVLSYITSNHRTEFVSNFFRFLKMILNIKFTSLLNITLRKTVRQNIPIRYWNSTFISTAITNKIISWTFFCSQSLHTTMHLVPPLVCYHSLQINNITQTLLLSQASFSLYLYN